MKYKFRHLLLHLIQGNVRILLLCNIVFSAFAIWIYHSLGNVASKINKCFLIVFFSYILSLPPNTFSSDVTKHGRANKPSTSCPEPGQNWMKDEDAYSASLYYIVQNYGLSAATLKLFTHWTFYSRVKCSYNSKSCTTYWFLVLLCYWGYWTVAELFVLDIYLYLNYYNLNQYTNMNNILTYAFTNNIIVIHGFSSILSFLWSVYCANSGIFIPFTALIVPFFFRSSR